MEEVLKKELLKRNHKQLEVKVKNYFIDSRETSKELKELKKEIEELKEQYNENRLFK